MSVFSNLAFLTIILFISLSVVYALPNPGEAKDEAKDDSNSSEEKSEKELGTVSPEEIEKLKDEIIENQEENSETFGLPLTSPPEEVETFLKQEEKELGKELPEKVEKDLSNEGDFKNFVNFLALFDKIESEASDEEEKEIEKSPAEMKEMKAEVFKLTNELNERQGLPAVSHEEFDKVWDKKKKKYGKKFPAKVEKFIALIKVVEEKEEPTTEVSETELSTETSDITKELPKDAFLVRGVKGKICILAKFHSSITITYSGKGSEQKVEVSVPEDADIDGECGGPKKPPSMQLSWEKFTLALMFNKTSEDTWAVKSVELTYDKSEPIFDGADDPVKVTAKSKESNLFETPLGKSYFCPAQEVIFLYNENQHTATVRLKEVHLQPYEVEDGKFSTSHRCNQVVIGGLDEEPFVQDETIPLAVGCTLALITLLILIGFSVHRAYNAAKVDYNTMP